MQEKIREVLSGVIDPNTGKDLVSSKALKKVTTEDGKTTVQIELDYPAKTQGVIAEEHRRIVVSSGVENIHPLYLVPASFLLPDWGFSCRFATDTQARPSIWPVL